MVEDPFQDIDVPSELEPSLRRHREHLAKLVLTLRSAGMNQTDIEDSITVMIASYKQELIQAIKRIVGHDN